MKDIPFQKIFKTVFLLLLIACLPFSEFPANGGTLRHVPFKRGVNLTGWFQAANVRQIQFTKFTRRDFVNIKNLGCDVIRLPLNLHFMTGGKPNYIIDPLFFYFLDQAADWAEELKIHLILDNHTFDPSVDTDPNIGDILIPVWTQMAQHYKDRSTYIYYEILNEPHGISDNKWNAIQRKVIDAIRAVDIKHTIIVGPADYNSYNNLDKMPAYEDDNLIYTFHFYDPFLFTHQGAGWTTPPMGSLSGVPFPYDAHKMPACPGELKNTWIQGRIDNYRNDGTEKRVKELLDIAAGFKNSRSIPLFCGEFGVYIPNSNNDNRVYWYKVVRSYLEEKGISWTIWDYTGGFGIFTAGSDEMFDYDVNIPLIRALGLHTVAQKKFVLKPDKTGFCLYSDYIEQNIRDESWMTDGILDYYAETNPLKGAFCIYWKGPGRYNRIGFYFKPVKDLSLLVKKGAMLDFWLRSKSANLEFDIRFVDTKTDDPDDHPWRNRFTCDESIVSADGTWRHVQIPLQDFSEQGSWDNDRWFNPQDAFDWSHVEKLEIVAEHHDLKGMEIWFDEIEITVP